MEERLALHKLIKFLDSLWIDLVSELVSRPLIMHF